MTMYMVFSYTSVLLPQLFELITEGCEFESQSCKADPVGHWTKDLNPKLLCLILNYFWGGKSIRPMNNINAFMINSHCTNMQCVCVVSQPEHKPGTSI